MNIINALRITSIVTNMGSFVGCAADCIIRDNTNAQLQRLYQRHEVTRDDEEMIDASNQRAAVVGITTTAAGLVSIGDTIISHLAESDILQRASAATDLGCAILNLGLIADTTIKDAKLRKTLKDKEAGHNVH